MENKVKALIVMSEDGVDIPLIISGKNCSSISDEIKVLEKALNYLKEKEKKTS